VFRCVNVLASLFWAREAVEQLPVCAAEHSRSIHSLPLAGSDETPTNVSQRFRNAHVDELRDGDTAQPINTPPSEMTVAEPRCQNRAVAPSSILDDRADTPFWPNTSFPMRFGSEACGKGLLISVKSPQR
jgi:hypothetical protein